MDERHPVIAWRRAVAWEKDEAGLWADIVYVLLAGTQSRIPLGVFWIHQEFLLHCIRCLAVLIKK